MTVPDSADDAAAAAAADALKNGTDHEKCVALAAMPLPQYDRLRQSVAESMGIRPLTLDKEVKKHRRPESAAAALKLEDPVPWLDNVEGAELLDCIVEQLRMYVIMPTASSDAAALWCLMSYGVESFFVLPMLHISSPQKRSGKSTLLMVLAELCRRSLSASNASKASIFRIVDHYKPTLFLDEVDSYFKDDDELRGIINCGHSRKTSRIFRLDANTYEPLAFDTFCPKALAGIGSLAGTIVDRSILIDLKRRARGEAVKGLRQDTLDLVPSSSPMPTRKCPHRCTTAPPTTGGHCSPSPTWRAVPGQPAPGRPLWRCRAMTRTMMTST
jgi:putative DNA primase/helicase